MIQAHGDSHVQSDRIDQPMCSQTKTKASFITLLIRYEHSRASGKMLHRYSIPNRLRAFLPVPSVQTSPRSAAKSREPLARMLAV